MEVRQLFSSYDYARAESNPGFSYCPRCGQPMERPPRAAGSPDPARPTCPACGFVQYRNPLPGVVTLIERDGFVLLGKRTEGSFRSGAWCLPGGFMEWSEDYLSAARREVREETGLEVKVRSILSVVSNFLSPHLHTLVIVLLATPSGGAERAGDDVSRLAWYPLGGPLPELAFEADLHIIERYAADRVAGAPVDPSHAG